MKNKTTALQIISISIIVIFSCFLSGLFTNWNMFRTNTLNSDEKVATTSTQNNASLSGLNWYDDTYTTNAKTQYAHVVYFKHTNDASIDESELNNIASNMSSGFSAIYEALRDKTTNNASIVYENLTTTSGTPVVFNIDEPDNTATYESVYNALIGGFDEYDNTLSSDMGRLNINLIFVYVGQLNSYLSGNKDTLISNLNNSLKIYNHTYNSAFNTPNDDYLKYYYYSGATRTSVEVSVNNFSIVHGDLLNAINAGGTDDTLFSNDVRNYARAVALRNTLTLFGMPLTSYIDENGDSVYNYAGNWDITSNGPFYSNFNSFYAQALNWRDSTEIQYITNVGDIDINTASETIYVIEPTSAKYNGQAIIIQPFTTYNTRQHAWSYNISDPAPGADYGITIARINTQFDANGKYKNASSTYIPYYIFTPTSNDVDGTRTSNPKLNTSYISTYGSTSIGSTELKEPTASYDTGYISLQNNDTLEYENSQLEITITNYDSSTSVATLKIECKNSEVLAPNIASSSLASLDIDPDVKILLYNIYVDYNYEALNPNGTYQQSDLIYTEQVNDENDTVANNITNTWDNFYQGIREDIFNSITTITYAFTSLEYLDLSENYTLPIHDDIILPGCRNVTDLTFLHSIPFQNLKGLSICDQNLSSCDKTDSKSSLNNLVDLKELKYLELVNDKIKDISLLSCLADLDDAHPNSKLEKISLLNNDIQDISILNHFGKLSYVNVAFNNISTQVLNTKYRTTNTTFFTNGNFDIGLQRMPQDVVYSKKDTTYAFKAWVGSTDVVANPNNIVLKYSSTFDEPTNEIVGQNTSSGGSVVAIENELLHGRYKIEDVEYYSLLDFNSTRSAKTLPARYINCFFLSFTYDEEEVCQTANDAYYDCSIDAYENLNELLNFDDDKFFEEAHFVFPVEDGITTYEPIVGGLNLKNVGTYEVSYTFKLKDTFKTNLQIYTDDSLIVAKKVIVYPYHKITCNENNEDDYNIKDKMLYKALLVLSGKQTVNVFTSAFNESNLGVATNFTLYTQDFYFYNVGDAHTPSIKELRATKDNENQVHLITSLDISKTAFDIYRKMNNLGSNDTINTDKPIISTIKGLEFINLGSIENINLNSMGIDDDLILLFSPGILPAIKVLNLADNNITRINNITNLSTLEYLDLSFNKISDATYLKDLTDPVVANSNGLATQTLKRVNLAFNLLNLVDTNKNQQFMLEDTLPNGLPTTLKTPNQIYIILVQNLQDYDVYSKTSKWNYFYTPAVYISKSMSGTSKKTIYSIKISGSGVAGGTGNVQGETFEKKQSSNTGYSVLAGRYTIILDFNNQNAKDDSLPFTTINKSLHYTIVIPTVKELSTSYQSTFPNNLLLDANKTVENNALTYYMLSTEYDDFVNKTLYAQYEAQWGDEEKRNALISDSNCPENCKVLLSEQDFLNYYFNNLAFSNALNNARFVLGFKAYIPHININYGSGTTYWNTFYLTSSNYWKSITYNTSSIKYSVIINNETIEYNLPLKIECEYNDNSKNPDINSRYIRLAYYITFNRSNSFASEISLDPFALSTPAQTDSFVYLITIKIIDNPEISLKDEKLENALKAIAGVQNSSPLHSYDFYKTTELNLSGYGITSFDKKADGAFGFDSFMFANLQKIDLSNNKLENLSSLTDFDPLKRLFINGTIFPNTTQNINGTEIEFKLTYLDLSYNSLRYITSIGDSCFSFPTLTVNLFGNNIDFFENNNVTYIKQNMPADATHAKVIVGIQGLKNGTTKLISYKENIENYDDEDSRARFFFFHGNTQPVNGYVFNYPGLENNCHITYDETDNNNPLFSTFYYTDTYYQGNKNYTVSYSADYSIGNNTTIHIGFNTTVIHQKMYIKAEYDENGLIINSDGNLYEDFKSDTLDPQAYKEYIQSILDKDIFTYENKFDAGDLVKANNSENFPYFVRIGLVETNLEANALTSVPYEQHYIIQHSSLSKPKEFVKYIYIVDKTCPVIRTTSDTSQEKYIITRGKVYDNYTSSQQIDSDISVYDEYDMYFNKVAQINVKIYKNDELVSDTTAQINAVENHLGINVTEVGVYKIVYTAIDSNGNYSEPYTRTIEIYYQPYAWIKLSDFSATFIASNVTLSAMVYRPEEDINKNTDPTFYWYLDGELVGTSKKIEDQSNETNYYSELTMFVQGAGNHNVEVYIDITKEAFEENSQLAGFDSNGLSLSTKATQVFILLDDTVIKISSIALAVIVVLVILLIIALKVRKHNKDLTRNTYEYTIEKHNRRK